MKTTEDKDPLKDLLSIPGGLYDNPAMEEIIMASVREKATMQERAAKYRRWGFWSLMVCFGLLALCWWLALLGQSDPSYQSPLMTYVLALVSLLLLFASLEIRWGGEGRKKPS
jgi:cytochrome bd-type quinol oxidase subunit 2